MSDQLQRRRVRAANSALTRIETQRAEFATTYGAASSAQQRFNVAATALRSAIAGRKQSDPTEVEQRLDALTAQITGLLDELHATQQRTAEQTIRADQRRIARNERRAAA